MLKFEFEDCPSKAVNIPKHIVKSQFDEQGIKSTAIVAKLSDIHTLYFAKNSYSATRLNGGPNHFADRKQRAGDFLRSYERWTGFPLLLTMQLGLPLSPANI